MDAIAIKGLMVADACIILKDSFTSFVNGYIYVYTYTM